MTQRFGVFGGTFDPPHIGHQVLAAEASSQLGLNKVFWVITPHPPHKHRKLITPLSTRIEMVEAVIKDHLEFVLSRVDIDRPPPHYAVDTLQLLSNMFPDAEFIYLMGGDSLRDLPLWHEYIAFVDSCHGLGVMRRPGDEIDLDILEEIIPEIKSKVHFIDTPLLEISASQIRHKINSGKSIHKYLHPSVYQIILKHKLYNVSDQI